MATFVVQIFPAEPRGLWNLLDSPQTGPWPETYGPFHRDSVSQRALRGVIPNDMAAKGLSDWEGPVRPVEGDAISFIRRRQLRRARKSEPPPQAVEATRSG